MRKQEVTFDPSVLAYRSLLELFFQIHDPTTYEQQGSDVGPSYRSAIFYTTEVQKEVALNHRGNRGIRKLAAGPVVSEINPEEPLGGGARAPRIPGALSWGL
jgi:peptide-methionine (S)-S-oxide reductase